MARIAQFRKTLLVVCITLVASLLADAGTIAPAFSLSLPLETPTGPVETPSVPVKTPTVPVKTPTLPPVKTPTVPVKTPTLPPVKTPTVPVKLPTVPVKPLAPPVKAPSAKTPVISGKAPALSSKTPSVSVKTPPVNVKTPAGSVSVPSATVRAPSAPSGGPSSGPAGPARSSATPPRAAASAATPPPGVGGSGASAPPLGTYGSPGVGYGEPPASEGSRRSRTRAHIARRERRLKATVARLGGCLTALPAAQRELLELRAGYGDAAPLSPRAAAARLHLDTAHIATRESQAVRALRKAARTHSCGRTREVVDGVVSFIAATFGSGQARAAAGGVEAVRYESTPIKAGRTSPSTAGRILGTNISPTASDVILVLGLLMALGAIVVVVLADAAGQGPRHEQWRHRVAERFRSLR